MADEIGGALPSRAVMTAYEALNWIAFGQAVDADLTGHRAFRQKWGFDPSGAENLAMALREIETGQEIPDVAKAVWAARGRQRARELTEEWRHLLPPPYLRIGIERWASEHWQRVALLNDAMSELIDRAAAGVVRVLACPARPADAFSGHYRPTPAGPAEQIDRCVFATKDLWLDVFGTVSVPGHAGYLDARFWTQDIAASWPAHPAPPSHPEAAPVPLLEKRGRRKPQGLDFREVDLPLLIEMHRMIQEGEAKNPTDAARALAKDAQGLGKEASKVTRLLSGYTRRFSRVQP